MQLEFYQVMGGVFGGSKEVPYLSKLLMGNSNKIPAVIGRKIYGICVKCHTRREAGPESHGSQQ